MTSEGRSTALATVGNALTQATRPMLLLVAGMGGGAATVGHLAASFSVAWLAAVVLFPAYGHAVQRHREHPLATSGLARRMLQALVVGTLVFAALAVVDVLFFGLLARVTAEPSWIAWVVLLAPFVVAEQYALGLCTAADWLDRYSKAVLVSRVVVMAAAVAILVLEAPMVLFLGCYAAASSILVLLALRGLKGVVPGPAPPGLLRDALAVVPNGWAWFMIAQGSVLVVQGFLGAEAAGHFTFAYLLLNLPVLGLQGIAMIWATRAARKGPRPEWERTKRMVPLLVAGHVILVLLAASIGGWLWSWLFGPGLELAFRLLWPMAIGAPGFALAYLLLPQLRSRGWFAWLSAVYLGLAIAYLAALAMVAPRGGLQALAWCTGALGLALAVAHLAAARSWNRSPVSS